MPLKPLVSILIITRNRSQDLRDTIENVLSQRYGPLELIVVENGSNAKVVAANRMALERWPQVQ